MNRDESYMLRALELARRGAGTVSPNPQVGCVIVRGDEILGEGWHERFGGPHAEVNAVAAVTLRDHLRESTVYVNLEPCAHTGKTPPCADLLIRESVKEVVIANVDPNPLVQGKGIDKLRAAGCTVRIGILADEGRTLNKRFFTWHEQQRPYIILKWAQTADGYIARSNYTSRWISNEFSRQWVHQWRSAEDAILVGTHTAAHDNPQLSVREWSGRQPVRIVLDRFLRLPDHLHLFDGSQPTLCYNVLRDAAYPNLSYIRVAEPDFVRHVAANLFQRQIQSVIVEGGRRTLQEFIDAGLWDEARVFESHHTFGEGIPAPSFVGRYVAETRQTGDVLRVWIPG
jgi:diaminohydroxyphosphoribosylaminopyrimidine deaminase/5-amino-6-(5-phosphoribosylamino)uracil reductase